MSKKRTGPPLLLRALRTFAAVSTATVIGLLIWGPGWVAGRLNPRVAVSSLPPAWTDEASDLLSDLEIVDLHTDALLWDRDLLERSERGHVDLPRLVSGRVTVQMFTAVTKVPRGINLEANAGESDLIGALAVLELWPPRTWWSPLARALHQADKLRGFAARSGGRLTVIRDREELDTFLRDRAPDEGTLGALLGVEGAQALEGDLANVDTLHAAGYRMLGLTHFFDTAVGGSAHGLTKGGLTPFGEQVLTRMDELGMLVDLAHASDALIADVTRRARRPVVASHTGVTGTCPTPRNLSDQALRQIAATGGVVGIGLWPEALCGDTSAAWAAAVRHATNVIGVAHVALGSDWDGAVPAIVDASETIHLVAALLGEGFSPENIRAILRGNVLRVLRATLPEGHRYRLERSPLP